MIKKNFFSSLHFYFTGFIFFLSAGFFLTPRAYSWDQNGHRIVGLIAEKHLTEKAKKEINNLLKGESLALVSTWADEIKSDASWDHTHSWHYVNFAAGEKIHLKSSSSPANILTAILQQVEILKDKKSHNEKKAVALKFLVHLIGDLHQPLHVGYGEDKGGNTIDIRWFGDHINLHQLWDQYLIESEKLSYTEYVDFLWQRNLNGKTKKVEEKKQKSFAIQSELLSWTEESRAYLPQVYQLSADESIKGKSSKRKSQKPAVGYQYRYQALPIVHQQLWNAGVRLGEILNQLF